jgi:hypothetical protein
MTRQLAVGLMVTSPVMRPTSSRGSASSTPVRSRSVPFVSFLQALWRVLAYTPRGVRGVLSHLGSHDEATRGRVDGDISRHEADVAKLGLHQSDQGPSLSSPFFRPSGGYLLTPLVTGPLEPHVFSFAAERQGVRVRGVLSHLGSHDEATRGRVDGEVRPFRLLSSGPLEGTCLHPS